MNIPKSSKNKIAFTGTNCSGKTTMAMDVTARLKYRGVLAELVSSQDRKITWRDEHFPVDFRAHYGMISNMVNAEVQAELKGDADVVITDRSVLDLYSIAVTDHEYVEHIKNMEWYIRSWATTYTKIYYLDPLTYQDDGKRPDDSFRMKTHSKLLGIIELYKLDNVVILPRHEIYKDIQSTLGLDYEHPIFMQKQKWQVVADTIGCNIIVKNQSSPISSDLDVFIIAENNFESITRQAKGIIAMMFGSNIGLSILFAPKDSICHATDLGTVSVYYSSIREIYRNHR